MCFFKITNFKQSQQESAKKIKKKKAEKFPESLLFETIETNSSEAESQARKQLTKKLQYILEEQLRTSIPTSFFANVFF